MKIFTKVVLATLVSLSSLSAHSFWVNSFESRPYGIGHTTVSLGWGHTLPIGEKLNYTNAKVIVENFSITSPHGEITNLRIPTNKEQNLTIKTSNFDIYESDIGLQKVALKQNSEEGVYKIEANSKLTFYTFYIDAKDRKRMKLVTMDKLKDIKKVLMSVKYQAFASSYLTLGEWEEQEATNKGLEIIPKTDLSNVKVGDLLKFEILFNGKPLNSSTHKKEYISALSNTFGQNDKFSLLSYIHKGKAQFRVQSPGQWMITCDHKEDVSKDGKLKELYGKVYSLYNASSLTFNVK